MNTTATKLEEFQNKHQELLEVLFGLKDCFQQLGDNTWNTTLDALEVKIKSQPFKIMVVGHFKVGKTTVINALLGEDILPDTDTTVITEIKWADKMEASLYFRDPLPSNWSEQLPEKISTHLKSVGSTKSMLLFQNELELQQEALEKLMSLPAGNEPIVEKIELYGDFELCKNGVELIDFPGINRSGTQSEITRDYLNQADVVLFVMNFAMLASEQEIDFITHVLQMAGHEYIFFVVNLLDEITPPTPEERKRIIDDGTKKLAPLTQLAEKGIFFLSASQALEGKQQGNQAIVESAGLLPLENALTEFLTENRGKIKLRLSAHQIFSVITELRKILRNQQSVLEQPIKELENKERVITPKLTRAREIKDRILSLIEEHRKALRQRVGNEAYIFLNHFADELPLLVETMPTTASVKVFSLEQQSQAEALIKEIFVKVEQMLQERIENWKTKEIQPLLESTFTQMTTHVEVELALRLEDFYNLFGTMQDDFSDIHVDELTKEKEIPDAKKFLFYISGLTIGNPFGGVTVTQFDMRDLWAPITRQIVLFIGLMVFRITQPQILIPIIPTLLLGGVVNAMLMAGSLTNKLKREIGEKVAEQLKKVAQTHANNIGEQVFKNTASISDLAEDTLEREINSLQGKLDKVLQDKQASETQVKQRLEPLGDMEVKVGTLEEKLKKLVDVA